MNADEVELHAWPPPPAGGQQVGRYLFGVLAIHKPTGIAFVSTTERSQWANRERAMTRLQFLVDANAHVRARAQDAAYSSLELVPWPETEPQRFNACTDPCDMWTGPCACGAWHTEGK